MPVPCWGCNGFTYWRRHYGCQNPQCWYSNEAAIQAGASFIPGKGKEGKTKAFARNKPPSPPPPERPLVPPGVPVPPPPPPVEQHKRLMLTDVDMKQETDAKLAGLQDAEVGQGWTDNQDIIYHLKHDPYFVQGEADNKDVDVGQVSADNKDADVGQGSADKQDADVGQGSADKSKPLAVKKKMKQKKREDGVSKKPKRKAKC